MKRKVPRGVPWILPLIRHGNDIGIVEMCPLVISPTDARRRRLGGGRITIQPLLNYVVIELFGPEHTGECLTHDQPRIIGKISGNDGPIELVSLVDPSDEDIFKVYESLLSVFVIFITQAQTDGRGFAGSKREFVICCCLCSCLPGIDCLLVAVNDVFVEAVFDVIRAILEVEEALCVRIIFRKEQLRCAVTVQPSFANITVVEFYNTLVPTS